MIDIDVICATVMRLSARHEVDPIAVVGLLAVHALVAVDFTRLRLWRTVAEHMSAA
jgi:hypothetical protein